MSQKSERSAWEERWAPGWVDSVCGSMASSSNDFTKDVKAVVLHPDFPGWRFFVTFSPAGVPVGFEVRADVEVPPTMKAMLKMEAEGRSSPPDAPPVTARFLRRLPMGEIQEAARDGFMRAAGVVQSMPELADHWGQVFDEVHRPGRRGRNDRGYAEVAALYVDACRSGSRHPVRDLAERLNYSPSQVRNILHAARSTRRGLLTAAPSGRHGGELTPKALALLAQEDA